MTFSRRLLALGLFCFVSTQVMAAPWRFIVTGDDRAGSNRPEDHNGVNTLILGEMRDAFLKEKPALVLFSGDLIVGPRTDAEMEAQLGKWLQIMDPVYKAGIKVYAIRGNHEMHVPHPEAVWTKIFTGPYALPENGPKGAEEMDYTVSYENALFVGLDEFLEKGDESHINQNWLDGVLKANHQPHIFVFAHKMAFRSGHHDDGMEVDPAARDTFIKSLLGAGERVVFFEHDHLYDRRTITPATGDVAKSLEQIVVGTAGAPLVKWAPENGYITGWNVVPQKHVSGQYGYAVVDVDGPRVTITYKARTAPGVYETADTFSYTLSS